MDDLERLTRDYWTAVLRVRRLPVPERDKALVLADVGAIYWKERAQRIPRPLSRGRRTAG